MINNQTDAERLIPKRFGLLVAKSRGWFARDDVCDLPYEICDGRATNCRNYWYIARSIWLWDALSDPVVGYWITPNPL